MPTLTKVEKPRESVPDELPAYRPPSWEIWPEGCDPEGAEEAKLLKKTWARYSANLRWFIERPKTEYSIAEVAELLAVRPSEVPEWCCTSSRGTVTRTEVLEVALGRATWDLQTFLDACGLGKGEPAPRAVSRDSPAHLINVTIDERRSAKIRELAKFIGMDALNFATAMVNEAVDSHSWKSDERGKYVFVNFIASLRPAAARAITNRKGHQDGRSLVRGREAKS